MKDSSLLTYTEYCRSRSLVFPSTLVGALQIFDGSDYSEYTFTEGVENTDTTGLSWIVEVLEDAIDPIPKNLIPIMRIDESSVACAVGLYVDEVDADEKAEYALKVVRWHIGRVPQQYQGELLDVDAFLFLESAYKAIAKREDNISSVMKLAEKYHVDFIANGTRPKSTDMRPVQLASQNVIIGLASLCQDQFFDGLRVPAYTTCQVPHLAANEGDRALAALLLCDAFQNGGTMEVRFGPHYKEAQVPPSLMSYARSQGVEIGYEDEFAITPRESRQLFLAVTPMPEDLEGRAMEAIDCGVISPERLCYSLMSGIWSAVELDYILATSSRVTSIMKGGCGTENRRARLAEIEICRSAIMSGMLVKRLDNSDLAAGADTNVRVFEDGTDRSGWSISEDDGVIAIATSWVGRLPWTNPVDDRVILKADQGLIVVPRSLPTVADFALVSRLKSEYNSMVVAILTPSDMTSLVPAETPLLTCPLRMGEIDQDAERRLSSLRVGRS
ncbi:hypothetical protein [Loktanella sp. SALINAS62]|uniref:hypothetical protein n=1 Tax=Loktanella sp. SALINAS62 TaxID=2706124 RepID=UPI001B8D20E1|nr:hypothetical protein [Loktanella sp. SALINAS62]MBS1301535.1 hypothetical protein [Loktanella sp. SALINAS62]